MGQRIWRGLVAALLIALMLANVPARPASAFECPCNVFGNAVPGTVDSGDPSAVTVGMWFCSDTPGYVTGIRFYKAAAGNEFFGYNTDASLGGISSGSISGVPVNTGNAVVGNGSAETSLANCVEYVVGASATTAADAYNSTMIYTAVPAF